jgi:hypothetical protein
VFLGEREPKALLSKLLEPADTAMAEWLFEPRLDSNLRHAAYFLLDMSCFETL